MEVKRVQKTIYVNKYVAFDGTEFDYENQCLDYEKRKRGERKVCDKCNGRGYIVTGQHTVYDNWSFKYETYDDTKKCVHCDGKGYLDRKEVWE